MKNEFVPYDIALAMKELGFNEPCFGYYAIDSNNPCGGSYPCFGEGSALLYQQAFRWFRDNSQFLEEKIGRMTKTTYSGSIWDGLKTIEAIENCTEQEAQNACLRKLIEIVRK